MPRVGPYGEGEMMTERRSLHSMNNNYDYNYGNYSDEAVDVDDAIANGISSRVPTARSRVTTAGSQRSTRTKPSRVSLSENGSLSIDYGVVTPVPPAMPPPPFPVFPPMSPVTHFGRNTVAYSELDTLKLANDVGSRNYWQMQGAGSPLQNGSPVRMGSPMRNDSPHYNGTLSDTTSTSGVHTGEDSSSLTDLKKSGSAYSGMYRNLAADEHQIIQGLRNRRNAPKVVTTTDEEGHRKDDDDKMSGGAACCLTFLVLIAQIFLHGVVGLVLFWVIRFHTTDGASFPFAWKEDPTKEFNLHPVLMIVGLIYFMGQAMLFYRSCRCCRRIWNKLFHTMFHLMAIPCVVIGFIAVLDSHNNRVDQDGRPSPIPNFYSLHSWMGATTMGLFAIQFIAGFFSFLLLLCCESATAAFRASLVPIHSAFGLTTFVLAVATACTGLTEKAFFTLSIAYTKWVPYLLDPRFNISAAFAGINTLGPTYTREMFAESLVINVMGACLVGLALVMPVILINPVFRFRPQRVITVTHDRYQ